MTKRDRAAAAAKWRNIARAFERGEDVSHCPDCGGRPGLCCSASGLGLDSFYVQENFEPPDYDLFAAPYYWPFTRKGDDCRVIAAGLIAAMYETGEFDA